MTDQRRRLRALVDESMLPGRPVYVLTAAVVDPRMGEYRRLMAAIEAEANQHHDGTIHASEIANDRQRHERLPVVEALIGQSAAVKFFTTVRAPMGRGARAEEQARQRCLAHLAVELTTRHQVGEIVLDSRDGDPAIIARFGRKDPGDVSTIKALVGDGSVPAQMKIMHRHDADYHQLWLADVGVYAAQQAITRHDPSRLARLAEKMTIREATFLPIEQRDNVTHRRTLSQGLDDRLAELHTQSLQIAARLGLEDSYGTGDQAQVDGAASRVEQAAQRLEKIKAEQVRWEQRHGRDLPPLEEYTQRDQPGRER